MDDYRNRKSFLASACLPSALIVLGLASLSHAEMPTLFSDDEANRSLTQRAHSPDYELVEILEERWQPLEQPGAKLWLAYSEDYMTKRVVDFGLGQVRISYQGKSLTESTPYSLKQDVEHFLQSNVADAYRLAGIAPSLIGQASKADQSFLNLSKAQTQRLYFSAQINRAKGVLGDVLTITINLPVDSLKKRAKSVQPMVETLAGVENISSALVMAIIHEENAFNFLAHAPSSDEVYNPELNVEVGIKRLAQLEQQFSAIVDDASRQLCVIAAYRVGVSEVARVFTGRVSLSQAIPLINQFSPRQVRGQLRSQLTLHQGGEYVQQVSSLLALYD